MAAAFLAKFPGIVRLASRVILFMPEPVLLAGERHHILAAGHVTPRPGIEDQRATQEPAIDRSHALRVETVQELIVHSRGG
jgi:hypothetical protein